MIGYRKFGTVFFSLLSLRFVTLKFNKMTELERLHQELNLITDSISDLNKKSLAIKAKINSIRNSESESRANELLELVKSNKFLKITTGYDCVRYCYVTEVTDLIRDTYDTYIISGKFIDVYDVLGDDVHIDESKEIHVFLTEPNFSIEPVTKDEVANFIPEHIKSFIAVL